MKLVFLLVVFAISVVSADHWDDFNKELEDLKSKVPVINDIINAFDDEEVTNNTEIQSLLKQHLNDLKEISRNAGDLERRLIADLDTKDYKTLVSFSYWSLGDKIVSFVSAILDKEMSSVISWLNQALHQDWECNICWTVASIIKFHMGAVKKIPKFINSCIIEVIDAILKIKGYEDYANVAVGLAELNYPIIDYVFENQPDADPFQFCGKLQDPKSRQKCDPFGSERFDWHVDLHEDQRPSYLKSTKPHHSNLKIALISDVHLDHNYKVGAAATCLAPLCCREDSVPLPLGASQAGYWGSYKECDTPVRTYDRIVEEMSRHKDVDVVYYLGDALDHFIWEYTYDKLKESSQEVFNKLRKSFPNAKIVSCIGNHESCPLNQFAPASIEEPLLNTTWLYSGLGRLWHPHLDNTLRQGNFSTIGSFSIKIANGLRVISLNNNVASSINWWQIYEPTLPKQYLDWFVQELLDAEKEGDRVHILTHMPTGTKDQTYTWTREYNRVIQRFANTVITAEFNGHTHADEFKLYHDEKNVPNFVAWNSGGTNSFKYYNLNYKIIEVNGQDYTLKSIKNYIFDLAEANENNIDIKGENKLEWVQLYEYPKDFGMADLSAKSVGNLIKRMQNDVNLREQYNVYYYKNSSAGLKQCNSDECVIDHICDTLVTVLWERSHCERFMKGIY